MKHYEAWAGWLWLHESIICWRIEVWDSCKRLSIVDLSSRASKRTTETCKTTTKKQLQTVTQRALLIVVLWTLQAAKSKIEYTKISRHHKKSQDGLTILHRIWQMGGAWLSCKVHTRHTRLRWMAEAMAEAWPAIRKEFALSELKICATSLLDKPSRRFLKPQYAFPRQLIKNVDKIRSQTLVQQATVCWQLFPSAIPRATKQASSTFIKPLPL